MKSETVPYTWRARRPKREAILDWEVAGSTGKKTFIQGLFSAQLGAKINEKLSNF